MELVFSPEQQNRARFVGLTAVGMVDELRIVIAGVVLAIGAKARNPVVRARQAKLKDQTIEPVEVRPTFVKEEQPADITPVSLRSSRRVAANPMNHPDGAP